MSVDTRPRIEVPAQPTGQRGIIRAGQLLRAGAPPRPNARAAGQLALRFADGLTARLRRTARWAWAHRVGLLLFALPFALYVAVGALLAFRFESFNGDAQARLANAYYVLFSRDPHMGAIGFVWNPLASISVMPLLLLKGLWPALATRAFAGDIMSAAFMAGSVVVLHGILRDLKVRSVARLILAALFAIQPMILYYGANGMSEAIFLFFLMLTCRWLSRWLAAGELWNLVLAGTALGFAYLARNEAVMPALLAAAVVAPVSALRAAGDMRRRVRSALVNVFVFAAPSFFAFTMWAVISWIIVGHPFEQFSSQYGNSSQLAALGDTVREQTGSLHGTTYVMIQVAALAPILPVTLLVAAYSSVRNRDLRMLAPITVLGGVVFFAAAAYVLGQTAGSFRYYIAIVPMSFILAGCGLQRGPRSGTRWRWVRGFGATLLAAALALSAIPTSIVAMSDHRVGREEYAHLGYIFHRNHPANKLYAEEFRLRASRTITDYLDAKKLRPGSVLMDTFSPCVPFIDVGSRNPRQFVITNDRDFRPILADPVTFRAGYLLVPPSDGVGNLDEINRTYPTLYANGAGIAEMEHEFDGSAGCPAFRLYRIRAAAAAGAVRPLG
ncbi:MAG: hypothetical protein JWP11_3534 [Frankiales bacterium]|nr:hypothetical protein [Frankiales bacterium]